MEALAKCIEKMDMNSYQAGEELCQVLNLTYNCFGNYAAMSKELYSMLSKKGKLTLISFFCLSSFMLCSIFEQKKFSEWDERVRASESFAHKNYRWMEELFEKTYGVCPQISHALGDERRWSLIHENDVLRAVPAFRGYAEKWLSMHSTIKQSFFGGMAVAVLPLVSGDKKLLPPLDYSDVKFPFI